MHSKVFNSAYMTTFQCTVEILVLTIPSRWGRAINWCRSTRPNCKTHLHYSYNPKQQFTGIIHKQSHILIFIFWYKCSFKSGEKYECFIPSCPESVTCSCFLVFVSVNKQGHIKKNSSFINTLT